MDLSCLSFLLGFLLVLNPSPTVAYAEKFFENNSICSTNVVLNEYNLNGHEDESALVIKDSSNFQPLIGEQEYNCHFTVSNPLGSGVFAVIQSMIFRQNAQGECIDYVQFRHIEKTLLFGTLNLKWKGIEPWGSKMCGEISNGLDVNVDENKFNSSKGDNDNEAVKNSFTIKKGLMEVKIHLGNRSVNEVDKEPSFEVVFTAFKGCKSDFGIWKSCGSGTCIHKKLFQDGKLNCPYKSCKDEGGCRPAVISKQRDKEMDITTLAIVLVIVAIMTPACCGVLWLLFNCWTKYCTDRHPSSNGRLFEMRTASYLDNMAYTATAPPQVDVNGV